MNFSTGGIPEVDVGPEGDGEVVVLAPVHQVEVVVVNDVGRVKNPLGDLGNVPGELLAGLRFARAIEDLQIVAVTLWR